MSSAMRDDASTFDADPLVAGAGPVGQTLATDLPKRGVSVLIEGGMDHSHDQLPSTHSSFGH